MMKQWILMAVVVLTLGCQQSSDKTTGEAKAERKQPEIRLDLNITNRLVHVLKGDDTIRTYPIAVGKSTHPTPVGEFKIHQIDWNPDWTPPDSEWSKDEDYTPPAHKDNPMGRARIIYQSPYSLHGTKNLQSLGEAESHGSVRMANADVMELARLIMEESGSGKPADWYEQVMRDSTKMVTVNLQDSIPLTNRK